MAIQEDHLVWEEDEFADKDAFINDFLFFGVDVTVSEDFEATQKQIAMKKLRLKRARKREARKAR